MNTAHRAQESRAGVATKWITSQASSTPALPLTETSFPCLKAQYSVPAPKLLSPQPLSPIADALYPSAHTLSSLSSNKASSYASSSPNSGVRPHHAHNQPEMLSSDAPLPHQSPKNAAGRLHFFQREVKECPDDSTGPDHAHLSSAANEKLYEAYNDLHSLAQDFHKPFDAPAILVVGHQTDGKSALVEALMGFQFNHVGGGTKTRRPITLHMKYNADCAQPRCFLVSEDLRPPQEEEHSLEEIQAYIETENMRLEREVCQFWAKEIVVKIEYKYCPNLTIIDTPGLISAAPGRKNHALQSQGAAVEALVHTKILQKEFIILCLEDCSDWCNATTRRVVMQADPELCRTVIISTKLDTRIPQFAGPADVELFLRPPTCLLDSSILGASPFFTSVPSGRVGSSQDSVFRSNSHFQEAVAARESQDVALLEDKLGRALSKGERSRIGVSRLRWFLEQLLQRRYMDSVPAIVPLLGTEFRTITIKLRQTVQDLGDLDEMKLKERGRVFRESFLAKLSLLLRGTVVAPPKKYGETLQDERVHGGAFVSPDGMQLPYKHIPVGETRYFILAIRGGFFFPTRYDMHEVVKKIWCGKQNASMHLYGGAQYHRAMAEFRLVVGGVKCQAISREEIVNACGVEDIHDGTNYIRTACVIATSKARDVFEPFLHQLGFRLSHILRRLLPVALYLLQRDGEYLSSHEIFMKRIATAFQMFVESTERSCREKCMEDLKSMTRYVTWSLHNKSRSGLRHYLDTMGAGEQSPASSVTSVGLEGTPPPIWGNSNKQDNKGRLENKATTPNQESSQTANVRLVTLLESTLWNRKLAPTSEEIVNALVAQIFEGIRDHCIASAEMKFNCFFLMPVVDKFPAILREDLEEAFQEDIDHVFDVAQVRLELERQEVELTLELKRVEKLQEKFASIHHHLSSARPVPHPQPGTTEENSAYAAHAQL